MDGLDDERATARALVFDDIAWNDGVSRAWNAISEPTEVAPAVDLAAKGIRVFDQASVPRISVQRPGL